MINVDISNEAVEKHVAKLDDITRDLYGDEDSQTTTILRSLSARVVELEKRHYIPNCQFGSTWIADADGFIPLKTVSAWQPIETAPKDGTDVLCFFPLEGLSRDYPKVVPCYYSKQENRWNYSGRAASGYSKIYKPTHWQPLPTPPKETP